MSSNRPHTARKPVGSGSAIRPVPEYGPSAGQITSSPYVNAIPAAVSELSVDPRYDATARRHSRESVGSDDFYDTEQQPEFDGTATGVTTQATSPTIAQAPSMFPQNTPAHLYHRFDGSKHKDPSRSYQRLPSEAPEPLPSTASRTPSNASSKYPWSHQDANTSSSSTLSKSEPPFARQLTSQPYPTSRHDSPASQYSVSSTYPLSMPDVPSPVVPDVPTHTVSTPGSLPIVPPHETLAHNGPAHAPLPASSTHNAYASSHSMPAQETSYSPFVDYTSDNGSQVKKDAHSHFKKPYLEGFADSRRNLRAADMALGDQGQPYRSDWHSQPYAQTASHSQGRPPRPPAPKHGQPFAAVYGEPYVKDLSSLDDEGRDSSDRSMSPTHSVNTDRDSSLSLGSESATNAVVNPANAPAAVSELPPGALYRRQVSTSARPRQGTPLTLASLANRNSSSDLSPHTSHIDTPSSVLSYPPFTTAAMATDSPASDHPSETPSRNSRASAASFGQASQKSRARQETNLAAAPESQSPEKPKDESLGIGVGSAYVQRIRVEAAETHISKVPAVLPIGIRARAKPQAARIQPEFLRKAMDIRYTHLPQRMLETEVDDDDVPMGQQQPPGVQPRAPSPSGEFGSLETPHRSHSPVESVLERPGKIKLFVANPDDDSD